MRVCLQYAASAVYITTACAIPRWEYQCRRQICFFPTRGRVLDVLESSLDDRGKEKVTVRTRKRHAGSGGSWGRRRARTGAIDNNFRVQFMTATGTASDVRVFAINVVTRDESDRRICFQV
jgi:hypothetical protein